MPPVTAGGPVKDKKKTYPRAIFAPPPLSFFSLYITTLVTFYAS